MSTEFDGRTRRPYQQTKRAEAVQGTRERIAAAAAGLHEEVGVSRATVSEIARRAGVTRLTVYQHFPDLAALLPACSAHYEARHPLPDLVALAERVPSARAVGGDVVAARREMVQALYRWYREVEPMFGKVFADRVGVPEVDAFLRAGLETVLDRAADLVARDIRDRVLVRLALDYWTWHRLAVEGLDDETAAALLVSDSP